jgi:hypothetical protein
LRLERQKGLDYTSIDGMKTNGIDSAAKRSTSQLLRSIPNVPCLKRHEINGNYYAVKKINGKIKSHALRSDAGTPITDRKLAERKLREWQGHQDGGKLILDTCTDIISESDKEFDRQELAKLTTLAAA